MGNILWHFLRSPNGILLTFGICLGLAFNLYHVEKIGHNCVHERTKLNGHFANLRDLRSSQGEKNTADVDVLSASSPVLQNMNLKSSTVTSGKLQRPRFYATELGIKEKLLVAILSSPSTIGTLAIAINRTLNSYVDKMVFFTSEIGEQQLQHNLPVVEFKGSADSAIVLQVLSYVYDYFLSSYDFFYVVMDQTYVCGYTLKKIVRNISISQSTYMGSFSTPTAIHCDLDGGIILSNSMLSLLGKQAMDCSFHGTESAILAQCIELITSVPCVRKSQGQLYQSYIVKDDLQTCLQETGSFSRLLQSVSVYPVRTYKDMFVLHKYFLEQEAKDIMLRIKESRDSIVEVRSCANEMWWDDWVTWPTGSVPPHQPPTRFDVIPWETFNESHLFFPDEFRSTKHLTVVDQLDIFGVLNASLAHLKAKSGQPIKLISIDYGHRRLDPTRGVDYILSLKVQEGSSSLVVPKIMEAFRSVTLPEIIPMPYVTENIRVTVIVTVTESDVGEAVSFLKRYESECMSKGDHTFLLLALLYRYGKSESQKTNFVDVFKNVKDVALKLTRDHHATGSRVGWVVIRLNGRTKPPSEFAITDLVVRKLAQESLVLITRYSAHFGTDFLNRVRLNTIAGWQVFSPIPYVMYHPKVAGMEDGYDTLNFDKNVGHFDRYNYDHVAFYVSDYMTARKSMESSIPLVRTEHDLELDSEAQYQFGLNGLFVRSSRVHYMRAVEPSLRLTYTEVVCHKYDSDSCTVRQSYSYGSRMQLSRLMMGSMSSKDGIDGS